MVKKACTATGSSLAVCMSQQDAPVRSTVPIPSARRISGTHLGKRTPIRGYWRAKRTFRIAGSVPILKVCLQLHCKPCVWRWSFFIFGEKFVHYRYILLRKDCNKRNVRRNLYFAASNVRKDKSNIGNFTLLGI